MRFRVGETAAAAAAVAILSTAAASETVRSLKECKFTIWHSRERERESARAKTI